MIKQTIEYTDLFTNEKVSEDHYFHLSKADLAKMELSHKGGFEKYLNNVVESEDGKAIIETFEDLIGRTYGVRIMVDGREKFMHDRKAFEQFAGGEAYSEFFMKIVTDANFAAEFVNGVMPADLAEQRELAQLNRAATTLETDGEQVALKEKKITDYTRQQLIDMSDEQFDNLAGTDPSKMDPAVLQVAYQRKSRRSSN